MKKSKIILLVLIFAVCSFLSSCMFPGPGHGGKMQKPHPGNNGHHNQNKPHK